LSSNSSLSSSSSDSPGSSSIALPYLPSPPQLYIDAIPEKISKKESTSQGSPPMLSSPPSAPALSLNLETQERKDQREEKNYNSRGQTKQNKKKRKSTRRNNLLIQRQSPRTLFVMPLQKRMARTISCCLIERKDLLGQVSTPKPNLLKKSFKNRRVALSARLHASLVWPCSLAAYDLLLVIPLKLFVLLLNNQTRCH